MTYSVLFLCRGWQEPTYRRLSALARAMGDSGDGRSEGDAAVRAILCVKRLLNHLDFPKTYLDTPVRRDAIPDMAKVVAGGIYSEFDPSRELAKDSLVPSVNIRRATMKDVMDLYEECFQEFEI